ncbi:hypothetical protein C8F04DRAFT_1085331 [Mycena alexandri]|uniref:NTF2 domain-containing protein n=1 Tax=Mycena alexandri TaxID=1745969 RepID=A0AAD6X934_9AGAR|nr:hypothetical protein C8F04DRAFT_1085331 [Mycena alexandri]
MSLARNFDQNRRKGFTQGSSTISHAEDSQPNESIDKRRAIPSLVVPSKPLAARGGRGRSRGWGNTPHNAFRGHGNARLSNETKIRGPSARSSGSMNSGSGRTSTGHPIPVPGNAPHQGPQVSAMPTNPFSHLAARAANVLRNPSHGPSFVLPNSHTVMRNRPPVSLASQASPQAASDLYFQTVSKPTAHIPLNSSAQTPDAAAAIIVRPRTPSPSQTTHLRVPDSPPPPKRRRISPAPAVKIEETSALLQSPPRPQMSPPPVPRASPPSTPAVRVKLEARTPSPPPSDPVRRAVRSGSKRYFPVPANCEKRLPRTNNPNPDFITNRRKWAKAECAVLRDLGLKVEKFFFRDDGMVIEWTSDVDVWLDNLRPVQERPRTVISAGQDIIDVDADDHDPIPSSLPRPRTPAARSASPIAVPASPPAYSAVYAQEEEVEVEVEMEVPLTIEEDRAQMRQLSIEYIKKYITTFDADRAAVAAAYTADAIVSFRDNNFACPTHFTFQRAAGRGGTKRTMPKLPALQNYRFSPGGRVIDVDYDTVALESEVERPTKVMLNVHAQLLGVGGSDEGRTLAIDQVFVLRRPIRDEQADSVGENAWPLLAMSHLMVVRDTPWVHWTGTLDTL